MRNTSGSLLTSFKPKSSGNLSGVIFSLLLLSLRLDFSIVSSVLFTTLDEYIFAFFSDPKKNHLY